VRPRRWQVVVAHLRGGWGLAPGQRHGHRLRRWLRSPAALCGARSGLKVARRSPCDAVSS
jgi:hypothetical protein